MTRDAAYWIRHLELVPHPEGGFYRETYRSDLSLPKSALPAGFAGDRATSTAIYFLLYEHNFSAFHRIRSDEMWHFYLGSPLTVHVIDAGGQFSEIRLGSNPEAGEVFQAVVKAGCWFASQLASRTELGQNAHRESAQQNKFHPDNAPSQFSLAGCTVAPGFDFADFEIAKRDDLVLLYPEHQALITSLTRT